MLHGKHKVITLLICVFIFTSTPCAASIKYKEDQLHTIINRINNLRISIKKTHNKRISLTQQLRQNETATGKIYNEIQAIEKNINDLNHKLTFLNVEKINYQGQLTSQQKQLAIELRSMYMLGRQSYLKLLLNNQDPNKINRLLIYYRYLQNFRIQLAEKIEYTLRELHKNKIITDNKLQQLTALNQIHKREYEKFTAIQQQRSHLLKQINQHLTTQKQKLTKLSHDKNELELIIQRLKRQAISAAFATPLDNLRKKLLWPVVGKIINSFDSKIGHSQLSLTGVVMSSPEGQEVHAISNGKVVFAQWLDGYGLLLIINHGHGYMSLYARNSSLYKKVGDIVYTGETIATVGSTGGFQQPSLYFAIRHNGNPVNPALWCKSER